MLMESVISFYRRFSHMLLAMMGLIKFEIKSVAKETPPISWITYSHAHIPPSQQSHNSLKQFRHSQRGPEGRSLAVHHACLPVCDERWLSPSHFECQPIIIYPADTDTFYHLIVLIRWGW